MECGSGTGNSVKLVSGTGRVRTVIVLVFGRCRSRGRGT